MRNKQIYFFVGTTAEYIKLAPLIREFNKDKVKFKFITSGQTKILFEDLTSYTGKIEPYIKFREKAQRSSLLFFGLWAIRTFLVSLFALRSEFKNLDKNNSYFIIHGDTVSSLIGALVATIYGLKIVHVESGLRSYNFLEPFPEEICRYIIIHLADFKFAPTSWALNNLKNLAGAKIDTGQNTLIETCQWALKSKASLPAVARNKKYYILTMHRQEHVFFEKDKTIKTIKYIIKHAPRNLHCVLVTHHLTASFFGTTRLQGKIWKRVSILPRLPYLSFMKLMKNAEFIATDGCTNQEEAYYMGLPLLALRNRTERIEGLNENIILSYGKKARIKNFLKNYLRYRRKPANYKIRPAKIIFDSLKKP